VRAVARAQTGEQRRAKLDSAERAHACRASRTSTAPRALALVEIARALRRLTRVRRSG